MLNEITDSYGKGKIIKDLHVYFWISECFCYSRFNFLFWGYYVMATKKYSNRDDDKCNIYFHGNCDANNC